MGGSIFLSDIQQAVLLQPSPYPSYLMSEGCTGRLIVSVICELSKTCQSQRFLISSKKIKFMFNKRDIRDPISYRTIGHILTKLTQDGYLDLIPYEGARHPYRYYVDKTKFLNKFGSLCG